MESIWHQTSAAAPRPPLEEDLSAEAAVIGGGMAGILTAALLEEAGVRTVVLEADRVGSGQTGNTTAKVTSQHGDCYRRLEERLGAEAAVQYAGAGQEAVEAFRQLIRRRRLDCAWEELPAYLYALSPRSSLEEEAAAQQRAGLPVRLTRKTGLPFPVKEALRCDGQGQLHPLRLLHALARELTVYEGARVLAAEGDRLHTAGGSVRAEQIIFACHFPFVNMPGYYFLRMHQERSYVLALSGAPALPGMYYSVDPGGLSLRTAQGLLLAGGGGHRTGENRSGGVYAAQDCMTLDGVPYIGPFSSSAPGWYVATGFGKWGMTGSMASALLLRDLILGRRSPWAELFSPQRFTPVASAASLLDNGLHAARDLGRLPLTAARGPAQALPPGHGGIVEAGGRKMGVYKTAEGTLYAVDPRCPHMGCQLEWNPDEESWDCPCHGSRFDCRGRLLSGPAQKGLSGEKL